MKLQLASGCYIIKLLTGSNEKTALIKAPENNTNESNAAIVSNAKMFVTK
jgi:hypothetical protein